MPSPFPGMNPYLEQEDAWHDFHESFMPEVRELLNAQVLPRYFVKIDEHVYIQERLSYLEIRDRHNHQLITVIELLSPSNKWPGGDRDQYLAKQTKLLSSKAHLVEIDLLRGGPRMPWLELPDCDYCAVVSRWEERPRAGIWPVQLRERLPIIPVPLRTGEPDATLDLQQILNRIYDAAGYEVYIYTGEPEPPLSADDAVWARAFLPQSRRPEP